MSELEARLSKDSHNSSKPPSSDGLKKTRSLRRPSSARPGSQVGHKGTTLKRVQEPDEVIEHGLPERCDGCGEALPLPCAQIAERRQVFDIPVVRYEATEHRILRLQCGCGKLHESQFLSSVRGAVQYEPNIRALAVHLTQGQLLPLARIAQALIEAPVVHADESGLRVASCLHWLHTAASETHTWYGEHARRGMEAIEVHGILPRRMATLVHDCWKPYWKLECVYALCNAHLLHKLVFLHERTGQTWPQRMLDMLISAHDACAAARPVTAVLT